MSEIPIPEDTASLENLIKTESALFRLSRDININISESKVFEEEGERIKEINESINKTSIKIFLDIFTAFKKNEDYKDLSQKTFSTFLDEFGILTKDLTYDNLFDLLDQEIVVDATLDIFETIKKSRKELDKIIDDLLDGDALNSLHFLLKNFSSLEYINNKMLLTLDIKDPIEDDSVFKEIISIDIGNKRSYENFMLKEHKKMRNEMKKFKKDNTRRSISIETPSINNETLSVQNVYDYMKAADEYYDNLDKFPELKSWFLKKYGDFRQWPLFKSIIVASPLFDGDRKSMLFSLIYMKLKSSGCYMIKNNDIIKLSGCDYYSKSIENQLMCSCGIRVDNNDKLIDCKDQTNNECLKPYCIGKCSSDMNKCIANTDLLQCNTKNIDEPDFLYYMYLDFNPLSIVPVVSNLKIINSRNGNNVNNGNKLKNILIIIGIILGILFAIGIFLIFYKVKI